MVTVIISVLSAVYISEKCHAGKTKVSACTIWEVVTERLQEISSNEILQSLDEKNETKKGLFIMLSKLYNCQLGFISTL